MTSGDVDALDRTFEAFVFDWDGTAVPDRRSDATGVRARIEALCAAGIHVIVVSGTHVGNVDGQLGARPAGPGRLHLCLNRGSEVFAVDDGGVELVWQRVASEEEQAALDRAAALTVERLGERGLQAAVVSQRLNRRKIDLITDPAWADPPKAKIDALLVAVQTVLADAGIADLGEVVAMAADAATSAGLPAARITSDVKHVEIGLTDKADSARWAAAWLARRGITGSLVLVAGDELAPIGGVPGSDSLMLVPELARAVVVSVGVEPGGVPAGVLHLGGGPARFDALLGDALARRQQARVPDIDDDPAWVVPLPSDAARVRVAESLGALVNGWSGVRGVREEDGAGATPGFVVSGVYTSAALPKLLEGPSWTGVDIERGARGGRRVDLRTGVLRRDDPATGVRSVRFLSAADPHAMALRVEGREAAVVAATPLITSDPSIIERDERSDIQVGTTTTPGGGGIVVAARDRQVDDGGRSTIERLAAWAADPQHVPSADEAIDALTALERRGFDRALAEHREEWGRRWAAADVTIDGSEDDQLLARLAVFHLLGAGPDRGEAAVGPRGLTGHAYGGHVFWDADVYVLPAVAALRPAVARAMLEYRIRRLPAARAFAARRGVPGARFPWESATDGSDVTPRHVPDGHGALLPIRTGDLEEHIVADVAWAAREYEAWTGDRDLFAGSGRDLLLDTARYWAGRVRVESDGRGHVRGVMGPDEYHDAVDDNAFTNVMARWNLRAAADLVAERGGDRKEAAAWRALADRIYDGWDPGRGLYEQFTGYWGLEPLIAEHLAPRPFAAAVLLGAERVLHSQLVKQPDVLMLHHLVPDELRPGALADDIEFYEPRTAHGSSLSPAIHASLLARAGRPDDALELYRLAGRLDLDDVTGTTAGGLHLATMGGLWQSLAYGFLGLRPHRDHLDIDPCLPSAWDALTLRLQVHGHPVCVRAEPGRVQVSCEETVRVRIGAGDVQVCRSPGASFVLDAREERSV